jgi:flagellar hook assembly protein FlgD
MIWGETVDVVTPGHDTSTAYELHASVPNPFNPETTIAYSLPEPAQVSLRIHSVTGQLVRVLERSVARDAGRFQVVWDARDDAGRLVSPGAYFYVMDAGSFRDTQRLLLLR